MKYGDSSLADIQGGTRRDWDGRVRHVVRHVPGGLELECGHVYPRAKVRAGPSLKATHTVVCLECPEWKEPMSDVCACDGCDATGKLNGQKCPHCDGTGRIDVRSGK